MSTATSVPATAGLEGDDALETLRATGRRRLALDAFDRFRAADGFSHARALAFQFALTLVPALITVIGLATALDQDGFTRVVRDVLDDLAPGAAGDLVTAALRQGSAGARQENGEVALTLGGLATMVAGTTAFGQLERGANRIYGVERDRPPLRKYGVAAALMLTAGVATLLAAVLVAGESLSRSAGWGSEFDVPRWPVAAALVVVALALLFEVAPRRRQPEPSWLVVGSGVSALLWLAFTGVLALLIGATEGFGATYGPLAGTMAVLLWTLFSAVALLLGLSVRGAVGGRAGRRHRDACRARGELDPGGVDVLLEGKNAVVYGAGGAIGGAVARTFAREGATVFLAGRTQAKLDALADEIRSAGGAAEPAEVDALDERSVDEHADAVAAQAGSLDVSFNVITHPAVHGTPLHEMAIEDFMASIDTAARTTFLTARAAARQMVRQRAGVILAFGGSGDPLRDYYIGGTQVAFEAIETMRRQFATELGPHGVRFVTLRTGGVPESMPEFEGRERIAEGIVNQTLLGRAATLADVGEAAAFAASDRAATMTAATINISCGALLD